MAKNDDREFIAKLQPFTGCLNSRLSVRACMIKHLDLLISLRDEGFRVYDILDVTGCSYSQRDFSSVLYQIKAARAASSQQHSSGCSEPRIDLPPKVSVEPSDQRPTTRHLKSVEQWYSETGIDISAELIARLESHHIDPVALNTLNLANSRQIINYLAQREVESKYK